MNEQAQPRSGDSTERDPFFQAVNMLRQQDTTAQQAAERFARPIEESADPGCLLDTNAWDPIHEAMIKTSDADGYRDKLFEMLLCLKTRPAVDLAGRSKTGAVSDQAGLKLWSDLPGYSWTLSDLAWWYHDSRWREEPAEYGSREKREQVANIAALEARLTACGLSDFSIECYERLSDILEDEHASLDIELPAVRETLVAAARVLYEQMGRDTEQGRTKSNREI